MGGKNRIAADIIPIITKDRKAGSYYVEPFCGGCNVIDKVPGLRIASDSNPYVIALFRKAQETGFSPPFISEEYYREIRANKDANPQWLVGYAGFSFSFGAKFFGGYRRDKKGDSSRSNEEVQNRRSRESLEKQMRLLAGVEFRCGDYADLDIPDGSVVYCDPPYRDTTGYLGGFDHDRFYGWLRRQAETRRVFISEYDMPDDFTPIWERSVSVNLDGTNARQAKEKLFVIGNN